MQLLVSTAVASGNFIGRGGSHTWLLVDVDVDVVVIAFTLGLVLGSAAWLTMIAAVKKVDSCGSGGSSRLVLVGGSTAVAGELK